MPDNPKRKEPQDRHPFLDQWSQIRRNKTAVAGMMLVSFFVVTAIFAPLLSPHSPNETSLYDQLKPPLWHENGTVKNILGTDDLGRDILSRLIHGARVSLVVSVFSVGLAFALGTLFGSLAGYYKGKLDSIIMRIMDIILAFPYLLLVIDIRGLQTHFFVRGRVAKAVDNVNLTIESGQTLGLVGESGCGKSVTAHSIIQLIPDPPGKIVGGQIFFHGNDLLTYSEKQMRRIRGNQISMIFQEPMTALNPVFSVGDQVGEVIRLHEKLSAKEARERVVDMFHRVGIPAADQRLDEYPHQMSGGMRQRVMIAMALACNPKMMIADEPTTALDVTIQAQILDLMNKLKEDTGASILFITHDLGVIAEMAQRVAVMYAGRIVEYADTETLFLKPKHPYTIGLMESIPLLGRKKKVRRLPTISGVVPSLFDLPEGCLFSDRCPDVFTGCREISPRGYKVGKNHMARCLKYA